MAILFHSLVDFNLQIPANALYFTVFLAIITGLSSLLNTKYKILNTKNVSNKLASSIQHLASENSIPGTRYSVPNASQHRQNYRHCEEPEATKQSQNSIPGTRYSVPNYKFLSRLVNSIIAIAFTIAVFGILQKLSYNGKLYWLITKAGGHFGPYINYDHFAGYMEMCIFLSLGKFISMIATSSLPHIRKLKDKIIWLSSKEANSVLIYLFLSIVMTTALFMSTSRGGIMSFSAGFVVFASICITSIEPRKRKRLLISAAVIVILIGIMFAWVGPEETLGRFEMLNKIIKKFITERAVLSDIRPLMWSDTINMIKDYPVTGVGLGVYRYVFPGYRTFAIGWGFLNQSHCDYLQLISAMGVVGLGGIIAFLGWYVRRFRECIATLKLANRRIKDKG